MKIGGITFWRNNYGSILQAYALQKYISEELEQEYEIVNQYSAKMMSISNLFDKLHTIGLLSTLKRLVGRFGLPKLRKRVESLQIFVDKYLIVSKEIYNEDSIANANEMYDGFICGSDQIWNPANTDLDSMYWLKFVSDNKLKISYAPSIGIEDASLDVREKIKQNLQSFDFISSREETGTDLINDIISSNKCKTVLDPTLIVNKSVWDDLSDINNIGDGYVFAYMLKGTKEERKCIESFAKGKKLKVYTMPFLDGENLVPYDFKFGDVKLWSSGPDEFIRAIRYAEYVFTDSFHCMVFSCIYHKTFFSFPKKGKMQMSRIEGLQKLLGTGNRVITSDMTVEQIITYPPIKWDYVDANVLKNRKESRNFLNSAIVKTRED